MTKNNVRLISSRLQRAQNNPSSIFKKRVCAYCRVSTLNDEQFGSFELQCSYYTEYINNNPEWQLVEIYADHGISGTTTANRNNFKKMIQDCKDGKIDLIITKSISRFARNTLDCLNYVRDLKSLINPVGVIFEKENIDTLNEKSEILLTILSSVAQEESRNISENIKWAIQKKYQAGIPRCPTVFLYGYDTDENNEMVIVPHEAEVIKRIYSEYLAGSGVSNIAKGLCADKIITIKKGKWHKSSVLRILKNEKYCGDVIMQKIYTPDHITHKPKPNNGERTRYYLQDNHPAIIDRELWNKVQDERNRRRENAFADDVDKRIGYSTISSLSNTLFCGFCGQPLIRTTQYKSKEARNIYTWQCRAAGKKACRECGYEKCISKLQHDEIIKTAFNNMLFQLKKRYDKLTQKPENYRLLELLDNISEETKFNDNYYKELVLKGIVYDTGKIEFTLQNGVKCTVAFTPHYKAADYRKRKVM
ncbi:MAG: recombinase family protein [Eubacteriales bacterium]